VGFSASTVLNIPADVGWVLERLEDSGQVAYLVGGSVRDALCGEEPSDWDIATAATPEQTATVFAGQRLLPTGLQYGTQTLLVEPDEVPMGQAVSSCGSGRPRPVQITSFRTDGSYADGRHPDKVCFSGDIVHDLARRDFTVNAMAYSPRWGLVDPFGGQCDLATRCLRAVGDADQRLQEDALRILRALRFAATLDLGIDPSLAKALHNERQLLKRVSPERIQCELMRMLPGRGIQTVLLEYGDVLAVFIPEVGDTLGFDQRSPWHSYDVWEHSVRALAAISTGDPLVRLALLLHDLGKPRCCKVDSTGRGHFKGHEQVGAEIVEQRLRALRFDNESVRIVTELVFLHMAQLKPEAAKRWLSRLGEVQLKRLIGVKRGDISAHSEETVEGRMARMDMFEQAVDAALAAGECINRCQLAVNGNDLLAIGVFPGPVFRQILDSLLQSVVDDRLPNEREVLLSEARLLWLASPQYRGT